MIADEPDEDFDEFENTVLNFQGQPKCLPEGCVLQPHQMDSLKWMASLYENKVNGILADEMVSKKIRSSNQVI